jgi:AraC family transcriptional activator of pobA
MFVKYDEIMNAVENIRFNKAQCGVDFLINTGCGQELDSYYFTDRIYSTDFFEILFFKDSTGFIRINDKTIDIKKNSVVFISPFQRHRYHLSINEPAFKFLIFKEDFLHDFLTDKYFIYRLHYCYQTKLPHTIQVSDRTMSRYFDILDEIRQELNTPLTNVEPILRSLMYYILSLLNREYSNIYQLPSIKVDNTIAYQFKQLIEQKIRTEQRVAAYAEVLGVSRVTLNKAVKNQFGLTAVELLKSRLILEIKEDLIGAQKSVKEISDIFGFSEPNHLMRFFKTQTGQTVGEYMEEYSLDKTPYQTLE